MDNKDICIKLDEERFNFRVAAVLRYNNKILIQKAEKDDFFSLVGGRVRLGEKTIEALIREVNEELNLVVSEENCKLMRICENFFEFGSKMRFIFLVEFNVLKRDEYEVINYTWNPNTIKYKVDNFLHFYDGVNASATALVSQAVEAMEGNRDSLLWQTCEGDLNKVDGKSIFDALDMGDAIAKAVVDRYLYYVSIGLANVINALQPEAVCIGGGISGQGEKILNPIRDMVKAERYSVYADKQAAIIPAALGNDAGIIGAALLDD